MSIGTRLKELRKRKELSQTELGEILGVHLNTISKIEAGKSDISGEILKKASELFEVSTDYLLTGKESTNEISQDEREIIEILRQDDALTRAIKEAAELKKKVIRRIQMVIEPERMAA